MCRCGSGGSRDGSSQIAPDRPERDLASFLEAGRRIVEITRRHYETDDAAVLPRSVATKAAFENAMTLDIAMGGSTNTVLHLLAAAQEGEVPFTMLDIDRLSRRVPCLCKVAPSVINVHVEDVHRAGGILGGSGPTDRPPTESAGAAPAIGPDVAAPRGDPSGDGGLMGALGRLQRWLD